MIESYSSIYALGHRYLSDLFTGPVVIQEKIDGSQFSFGVVDGRLQCRSRGQEIHVDAPEKMFSAAVESVKRFQEFIPAGYIFRCEYLQKPKHNALAYSRVPKGNLVLFDAATIGQNCVGTVSLRVWAEIFQIEPVPVLFEGSYEPGSDFIQQCLDRESVLGGCKIEGVVVKNYNQFGPDKKILIGKFVSPAFKEVHRHEWRKENPTQHDIVQSIIADYKTSPRWCKAIQHLNEAGQLVNGPEDIGKLIKEVQADVLKEEYLEISSRLFKHFWPQIARGIISGLPEWYKQRLAENFSAPNDQPGSDDALAKSLSCAADSGGSGQPAGQNPTDP